MFKTADKADLNQISLTGLRALVFIGLLISKPRSFEEIRNAFMELKIIEKTNSDDILRIDLNTIKIMGCEIQRCSQKTGYKYILTKHPFSIKITTKEVEVLKKVYNSIKKEVSLSVLLKYDELFKKIAFHVNDEETREALLGVSVFKYFDPSVIAILYDDCKFKRSLKLVYRKVSSKYETTKNIIAQDLVFKNDKIYLHGFDKDIQEPTVLNLRNILSILERTTETLEIPQKSFEIKFRVRNFDPDMLEENETILEAKTDYCVIRGIYHNEFLATQRIMSFGAKCVVLEPLEFKNSIIEKIKEMRKTYGC